MCAIVPLTEVEFQWVPDHVGLPGDRLVKAAFWPSEAISIRGKAVHCTYLVEDFAASEAEQEEHNLRLTLLELGALSVEIKKEIVWSNNALLALMST